MNTFLSKVISGGQTGVDRAALDVALELGLRCGGWCPKGRWAEDGSIPPRYPLQETPSEAPEQRTEWNVRDSDGTLILTRGELVGGTTLTRDIANRMGKPSLVVDLEQAYDPQAIQAWIRQAQIQVLNIAGPRESEKPGIYDQATRALRTILTN